MYNTYEYANANKRKKIISISVILLIGIVIALIVVGVNASARNNAHMDIIGKSFEGECRFGPFKAIYKIEFINETKCHIITSEEVGSYIEPKDLPNVEYRVKGGTSGVYLIIGPKYFLYDSAEPFYIRGSGNDVYLYTSNYNSGYSMKLDQSE